MSKSYNTLSTDNTSVRMWFIPAAQANYTRDVTEQKTVEQIVDYDMQITSRVQSHQRLHQSRYPPPPAAHSQW